MAIVRTTRQGWVMGNQSPSVAVPSPVTSLIRRLSSLPRRAWLGFLAFGLGMTVVGELVGPANQFSAPPLTVMGFATVVAILMGVRSHRPSRPWPWLLLAGCTFLTSIGRPFLSVDGGLAILGQFLMAAGALLGFVGFVMLIRGRIPGGDRAALLDAAILASGTGVLIWAFGFGPYAVAARQGSVVSVAVFYPAIIALAMVGRMWFLRGAHRPATRLIVLVVVASNVIIILGLIQGMETGGVLAATGLLANFAELVFLGAAALHPAMAVTPDAQGVDLRPISRARIAALLAALLVNPATLAIEAASGRHIDVAPYIIGGVLIAILVVARLSDTLRQLGDSYHERGTLMDQLGRQALHDGLTSLPNRTAFNDRLAADFAARSTEAPMAVLLIDLDEFKAVNDTYGHEAGDNLLASAALRLRGAIRDGDMAARLGGDEFVISLPACADGLVPVHVGERVLAAFREPFDVGGHLVSVRVSVGIAVAGPDDQTPDDVIRNADLAMYLAKKHGKARIQVFNPSMQADAITLLKRRTDLAAGIANGELRLHYQPVVNLLSARTIGYEALVRWLHDGRLVPPMEFIPLAESSGLIGPLTDWVVGEACRTVADWGRPGDRPWVSINLSSSQLVREDIVAFLGAELEASGLSPDRLVIELTESSLLEIDVARPAIERLSGLGVRLAIDDFGTGYSALSYLASLPIDILKIDRSFVVALEESGPEEAIAMAIIALSKRLGITTIGEGVETMSQNDQLAALGCDLGQGYFIGRPAEGEDLRPTPMTGRRPRLTAVPGIGTRTA
jgi:diguanylate cyclase (GGDEF)-like protein